jgi:hypothetical protein
VIHYVAMSELLFVHHPSFIWAVYSDLDSGPVDLATYIHEIGGPISYGISAGIRMTRGTLTADEDLCSADLYFNPVDGDGSGQNAWGPAWSTT